MRATQFKRQITNVFSTAKCPVAIPVSDSAFRDALILAALDPAVRSIEFLSLASISMFSFGLNGIVLDRGNARYFLHIERKDSYWSPVVEETLRQSLDERGLKYIKADSEYLRREPRLSNCREVWRYARASVPFCDRLQIMGCLAEEGPQSLFELEMRINPSNDLGASIYALACADLLELELETQPLGPRTIVRGRR
jgi:hypothetical protein